MWRRLLILALGIGAVTWTSLAIGLDRHGAHEAAGNYDVIVVAGCRVRPDGSPSLALQRRTRHAVRLHAAGAAPKVVFTGGVGDHAPAEAIAASDYAVRRGLPPAAIVLEKTSTSTEGNAREAAAVLSDAGIPADRVLVVTDAYHAFRAQRVFARHFPDAIAVGTTPEDTWTRWVGAAREVAAIAWYALLGRL